MSYRSIFSLDHHCYVSAICKRSFSQVSGALTHKSDTEGMKGGGGGSNSNLKVYNKYWKRKKAFAAHRRNAISNSAPGRDSSSCKASASRGPDMVGSNDRLFVDETMDVKLETTNSSDTNGSPNSNSIGKPKQSRSKKRKIQSSDANAACDEATQLKGSEQVSQSKKPNPKNNKQSPVSSQVSNLCHSDN